MFCKATSCRWRPIISICVWPPVYLGNPDLVAWDADFHNSALYSARAYSLSMIAQDERKKESSSSSIRDEKDSVDQVSTYEHTSIPPSGKPRLPLQWRITILVLTCLCSCTFIKRVFWTNFADSPLLHRLVGNHWSNVSVKCSLSNYNYSDELLHRVSSCRTKPCFYPHARTSSSREKT